MRAVRRVARRFEPAEVTTIAHDREQAPQDLDLPKDATDRIWRVVEALYETGVHPAISICIRRHGRVLMDRAIGHSHGNGPDDAPDGAKTLCTPDTPFCLFSASKAVTAILVHALDDRGLLHVGDRVSEYIPEFARHGKEGVTIRHVLSHRSGFPSLGGEEDIGLLTDPARVVDKICNARPSSAPGRRVAYHAITGGFILGEIIERVTGRDIRTVLREEILDPLGFEGMNYGCAPELVPSVAQSAFTGPASGPLLDFITKRALGVPYARAAGISNSETWLTSVVPSGNIVSTAHEASRFFQLLLQEGELDKIRVFSPRTLRRARIETSHMEMDFTLLFPIRYGEGLMLGDELVSIFGPDTPSAYGHLGFSNVFCWADPDRQISVAILTSGKPLFSRHLLPLARLLWTISRTCRRVG